MAVNDYSARIRAAHEAGKREGRIDSMEKILKEQTGRLNGHDDHLAKIDKFMYGIAAIIVFVQFTPELRLFING